MSHKLEDVNSLTMRVLLGNRIGSGPVTLAINAGAAATVKSTGAINFTVDNKPFTKAALAALVLAVNATLQPKITFGLGGAFYVQPVSTTVYYILVMNAAGTVTVLQGTYAGQTFPGSSVPTGNGAMPDPEDAAYVCLGGIKIVTNASTTFTPATTALDAAGLTVTFFDLAGGLPVTAP